MCVNVSVKMMWNKIVCFLVGHKSELRFHKNGVYWCHIKGGYDDICGRCGWRWETTKSGLEALKKSQKSDPRTKRLEF